MRATVLGCLLALCAAAPAAADEPHTAAELFPTQDGNVWEFEVTGAPGQARERIEVVRRHSGWVQLRGFFGRRWWWMSDRTARVWVWNDDDDTYTRALDFGLEQGHRFTAEAPSVPPLRGAVYELSDHDEEVRTPAGTFTGCVVLSRVEGPTGDAGLARIVLAPGIGPVELVTLTPEGQRRARLRRAVIAGAEHPAPGSVGLGVCLRLDRTVLRPGRGGGGELTVSLRVENGGSDSLRFTFRSGQSYDVVIRDEGGQVVYRWSQGRSFTLAQRRLELEPGDAWRFEETIALDAVDGGALPTGDYTIEMRLTTEHPVAATGRFRVGS